LQKYQEFLGAIDAELTVFKAKQQQAFNAERERWAIAGEFTEPDEVMLQPELTEEPLPAGAEAVLSHVSANVWQVLVETGAVVAAGDQLLILEAMKMEILVVAEESGVVTAVYCQPGQMVVAGQRLLAITKIPSC
jgi:urea carboxylase